MTASIPLGVFLAISSTACFAGNRALPSGPLVKADPVVPTYISLAVGLLGSGLVALLLSPSSAFASVTLTILAIFGSVGILNFGVGRQLTYLAVRHIGANQTSPLISTQVIYAFLFAVLLINEKLNVGTIGGAVLILIGGLALEGPLSARKREGRPRTGYMAALLAAAIFGFVPYLIKLGLSFYRFFLSATFIGYAIAMMTYGFAIRPSRILTGIRKLPRFGLLYYMAAGIFATMAQMLRFAALSYAPIVTVAPILASQPIFVFVLTRKFAKDWEVFRLRTLCATLMIIVGTIIVSLSSQIST